MDEHLSDKTSCRIIVKNDVTKKYVVNKFEKPDEIAVKNNEKSNPNIHGIGLHSPIDANYSQMTNVDSPTVKVKPTPPTRKKTRKILIKKNELNDEAIRKLLLKHRMKGSKIKIVKVKKKRDPNKDEDIEKVKKRKEPNKDEDIESKLLKLKKEMELEFLESPLKTFKSSTKDDSMETDILVTDGINETVLDPTTSEDNKELFSDVSGDLIMLDHWKNYVYSPHGYIGTDSFSDSPDQTERNRCGQRGDGALGNHSICSKGSNNSKRDPNTSKYSSPEKSYYYCFIKGGFIELTLRTYSEDLDL